MSGRWTRRLAAAALATATLIAAPGGASAHDLLVSNGNMPPRRWKMSAPGGATDWMVLYTYMNYRTQLVSNAWVEVSIEQQIAPGTWVPRCGNRFEPVMSSIQAEIRGSNECVLGVRQ